MLLCLFLFQIASIHNHANHVKTAGMGEFIAVLNGIEFRTRHNDYALVMPHRTKKTYGLTEDIPYPDTPPSVLNKKTLSAQVSNQSFSQA